MLDVAVLVNFLIPGERGVWGKCAFYRRGGGEIFFERRFLGGFRAWGVGARAGRGLLMVPDFMNWVGVDVDVGCGGFLGPTPLENLDGLEYGYRKPFWIGMRFGLDTFIVSLLEKSALEMQCLPSLRLDNVMDIDATSSGLLKS